jgi:hypothetical protein
VPLSGRQSSSSSSREPQQGDHTISIEVQNSQIHVNPAGNVSSQIQPQGERSGQNVPAKPAKRHTRPPSIPTQKISKLLKMKKASVPKSSYDLKEEKMRLRMIDSILGLGILTSTATSYKDKDLRNKATKIEIEFYDQIDENMPDTMVYTYLHICIYEYIFIYSCMYKYMYLYILIHLYMISTGDIFRFVNTVE